MSSIPPTLPFHISRAYGVQAPQQAQRTTAAVPAQPTSAASGPSAKLPTASQRLVGASVPGRVDFSGAQPAQAAGTLAMYKHPADRNAAATAVQIGRSLDVRG